MQALLSFLSEQIVKKHLGGNLLLSTKCESVVSSRPCDVSTLQPCNNSQDQARIYPLIFRMLQDMATIQHNVRTVDSDTVVLLYMLLLNTSTPKAFGVFRKWGKHSNIPIHDTYFYLRPSIYLTLPIFHAIKRCDTTSHFLVCGKNIAWAIHQDSLTNAILLRP